MCTWHSEWFLGNKNQRVLLGIQEVGWLVARLISSSAAGSVAGLPSTALILVDWSVAGITSLFLVDWSVERLPAAAAGSVVVIPSTELVLWARSVTRVSSSGTPAHILV